MGILIFIGIVIVVSGIFIHATVTQDYEEIPEEPKKCVMCHGKVTSRTQSMNYLGSCHEWCETYY